MTLRRKKSNLRFSAAAAFSRQNYQRGRSLRGKAHYEDDSPGDLYKYISAGGIQTPGADYEDDRPRRRSPAFIYALAAALLVIWIIF